MGIRMEKTVFQYLLTVIFCGLPADFRHIIALLFQFPDVVNLNSFYITHNHNVGGGQFMVNLRAGHIFNFPMIFPKGIAVSGFLQKIHFLLGGLPQFINNRSEIDEFPCPYGKFKERNRASHQFDVFLHDFMDLWPLNFDNDLISVSEDRRMNLGDGRGAQRFRGDFFKKYIRRLSQFLFYF